jgi:hypothetical protein
MTQLILKRAPVGQNPEDYSVIENGAIVGRIFFLDAVGPQGRPWMWASGHNGDIKRAAHGTSRRGRRRWRPSSGVGGGRYECRTTPRAHFYQLRPVKGI